MSKSKVKQKAGATSPPVENGKRPPRVGELVLVEHGSSARGQVALVVASKAPGMVGLRKFLPESESFAPAIELPAWKVKGNPSRTDERATRAREVLAEHKGSPP